MKQILHLSANRNESRIENLKVQIVRVKKQTVGLSDVDDDDIYEFMNVMRVRLGNMTIY